MRYPTPGAFAPTTDRQQAAPPEAGTGDRWVDYCLTIKQRDAVREIASLVPTTPDTLNSSSASARPEVGFAQSLRRDILALFGQATHEDFELGTKSDFIHSLDAVVARQGTIAVEAIANIILTGQARPHVAAQALVWLGDLEHKASYGLRFRLLLICLQSASRWIRDGAGLGLDSMEDRRAIPALRDAITREGVQELRKDLEAVLHRLEFAS